MAPVPKILRVPRLPPGGPVPGLFCRDFYHNACVVVTKMETEEKRTRSPKKSCGINWTDEATEALLELWAEESIQMSLKHSKSSKETRAIYENLNVSYVIVV